MHQAEAFAILAIMLMPFASDRLRDDLVAGLALIAGARSGIVAVMGTIPIPLFWRLR